MDAISFEYTKQRCEFGRHPSFNDTKTECISIRANPDHAKQWVKRKTTTTTLDCVPVMAEHSVNTERFVQMPHGVQHTDGGWPKDVKSDMQDKERYLRRIQASAGYASSVVRLVETAENIVQQNNTIDLYEDYFSEATFTTDATAPSAKTLCVLRDPTDQKRAAAKVCWHPDGSSKLAVSYSLLEFQKLKDSTSVSSFIWDVNSPNEPVFEVVPPSPLCCLVYNPRSPDQLVGGCYNGLVSFWDLRKSSQPIGSSVIEKSHRDPVYDVAWIQSRTGSECVSVSVDGQVLWWDVRKLGAGPTDSMLLQANGQTFGATCLEYRSDAGATRYLVGTEQGVVLLLDRKAKKDAESQKQIKMIFGADGGAHYNHVYSIQRHPVNAKFFLTVGDWTARVWQEDLRTPIIQTPCNTAYLSAACWSPTRAGVFFATRIDGCMEVWDYYYRQNAPVFSSKLGDVPLSSICVHPQGKMVAVGAADGTITVMEISEALWKPQTEEKQMISHMFDREMKREKTLEVRFNQLQRELKKKKKRMASAKGGASASLGLKETEVDAVVKQAEESFFKILDKLKPKQVLEEKTAPAEDTQ